MPLKPLTEVAAMNVDDNRDVKRNFMVAEQRSVLCGDGDDDDNFLFGLILSILLIMRQRQLL